MHVYEHEDAAEETEYSFVLQVHKTYDNSTRNWWSCYGNNLKSAVLDRYHKTKETDPTGTYRIIQVTKHITRQWEVIDVPQQTSTKYTLKKKPNGYDFGARYIVEDTEGMEVFSMTSDKLWDAYLILKTKEKVIEVLLGQGTLLSKTEKDALEFLVNETYSEFMNRNS